MLGWSINLFRVRGIRLAVHTSFFLLLAWVAEDGWSDGGRWAGLTWSVLVVLGFFVCVILHELGHSFTARHFGIGVRRILVMPIGGMAEFEEIPREPVRELWITLAGPAVNFVIAALLWAVVGYSPGIDFTAISLAHVLLKANLFMGCFNLLPIFPMDGGRILRATLAWRMPYLRATSWAVGVGGALAVSAVVIAALTPLFGALEYRIQPAVLFTFIAIAGQLEYRAVRRRELEDAHWRAVMARLYGPSTPDEPPLLAG